MMLGNANAKTGFREIICDGSEVAYNYNWIPTDAFQISFYFELPSLPSDNAALFYI